MEERDANFEVNVEKMGPFRKYDMRDTALFYACKKIAPYVPNRVSSSSRRSPSSIRTRARRTSA